MSKSLKMPVLTSRETKLEIRAEEGLPAGICGQMSGIALVYGVRDSYGTKFKPGCMDRTKREKVAAKKVQLYLDHVYGTRHHIGYITRLETVGDTEIMFADIFDTEEGRKAKEYLGAVMQSGANTGLSIGFYERKADYENEGDGTRTWAFEEIEMEEISITPRPAVPGASVTSVRSEKDMTVLWSAFEALVRVLPMDQIKKRITDLSSDSEQSPPDTQDATTDTGNADDTDRGADDTPIMATEEERMAAYRSSLELTSIGD